MIAKYISWGIIIYMLLVTHRALGENAWNASNTWKATIIVANQAYKVPYKALRM
jgi:hypothetical protein